MLLTLKEKLGSLTKALDIIYVIENVKPVSRIMIKDDKELPAFLKESGLHCELSDFKILKYVDNSRGYSDKGVRAGADDKREGDFFLYISRKRALAEDAKMLEDEERHAELGRLLGYPECCCNFFERHFSDVSRGTNDFTISTFRESEGISFPWQNNNCLRGFDISLISHFPCSFNCGETRKIAERNLSIISKYDSDTASYFRSSLRCGVIYAGGVGVYSLRKMWHAGQMMLYSPESIIPSCRNDFYNLLKRRNRLKLTGKNDFRIGEIRVNDDQTFFGLFS